MPQKNISKPTIKAVIFDFDGVILESAEIKTEAFLELFDEYPEHQDAILNHHIEHQGITRYDKFRWIYKNLLNLEYNEKREKELGQKFSDLVYNKIMKADPVPGAIDLLEKLEGEVPTFVASGTPDEELNSIIKGRSLRMYFNEIYGSNRTKEEIIKLIQDKHGFKNSELLFIGDATSDYKAAKATDLHFVARNTPRMAEYWQKEVIDPVENLMEIYDRYVIA